MPPKLLWVLLPLVLYALLIALLAWRQQAPSRLALNVQSSLLLLAYLLATAGLGLFWVANQQLPVFDWHYLFGYATLLLVALHLVFNLPLVVHWLRHWRAQPAAGSRPRGSRLALGKALALVAALAAAFFVGTRQGGGEPALQWRAEAGSGSAGQGGAVDAVIRYHEYSSQSRASVFQRAPGVEWGAPPPVFKQYPEARQIALPRGSPGARSLDAALRGTASRTGPLRQAELGEMLYLAAGVTQRRGGNALRAAPSSGALFPGELYLVARTVEGLPAGLYHYDPAQHRLEWLGAAPAAARLGAPQAEGADALVLLSAVFRRTGYKYRNRAWRYAVADGGHLLENLRLAALAAGMRPRLLAQFDEQRAASALGIDGVEEGVLALVELRRTAAAPAPPGRFEPAPMPAGSALGVTGMVQRATSLQLAPAAPAAAGSIGLPPPLPAARDLHQTIVDRRSQRRFGAEPVPLAALSSLLADVALAPQLSDAIRINLVVNRVDGLTPGIYRYLPQHALQAVRAGQLAAAAQSAALSQEVIGDAAVVLVLSAERAPLLAAGARGYRHGFLEAGMLGERWLLGAVARGLAACPVGAFYDDEAATLLGIDPRREWVLHFAALGQPPEGRQAGP